MTLKSKVVTGTFWIGTYHIFNQILTLIINIALARLLIPEDFGLITMALVITNSITSFQNLGVNAALIYWPKLNSQVISTACYLILLTSSFLVTISFFLAPYVAIFYNEPLLTPIFRVLTLGVFLHAPSIVPIALLDKELQFRKQLLPNTIPLLLYGLSTLWFAKMGLGVWSLVIGKLFHITLKTIIVWLIYPLELKLFFSTSIAKQLFDYGKYVTLNSFLVIIFLSIDNIIIGRVAGDHILGLYITAFAWGNLSAVGVTTIFGRVLFPTLSKFQHDFPKMGQVFIKAFGLVFTIIAPFTILLLIFSEEIISILYTEVWMGMSPFLRILSLYGLFRSMASVVGLVFKATNNQFLMLKVVASVVFLTVIVIYPVTTTFGVIGTATLLASIQLFTLLINSSLINKIVNITYRNYVTTLFPPVLASLTMIFFLYMMKYYISNQSLIRLIILGTSGIMIYGVILHIISKGRAFSQLLELYQAIRSV